MTKKIEFYRHDIADEDISLVSEVLRSLFLTTGPMVARFESEFARYLNIAHAVGLNSCTGALHLALLRYGIGEGDEVITTPMTFVATATSIIESGAKPVFVDVCPKSGLLLPENVESAITDKTKAILPVHLYGRMVDMKGFSELSSKYNLTLIEDSAHCIEGVRDGIRPGQLSDAACFSFYATKNMTCGEGGALVCRFSEDASWYRSARHHGIARSASSRYANEYVHWDMEIMGWKYNMDDIHAALLINQIDRLEEQWSRRRDLELLYRVLLESIDGLDFLESPQINEKTAHHLFTVLLPKRCSRDEILIELHKEGIGCAVNYRAIHTLKYFRTKFGYKPDDFPNASMIGGRTISLPLYPKLNEDDVRRICKFLKEVIR